MSGTKRLSRVGLLCALASCASASCLPTPEDTDETRQSLACRDNEALFQGACRTRCATNAGCADGDTCMLTASTGALCLSHRNCAYLDSDTTCTLVTSTQASAQDAGAAKSPARCVGNATWKTYEKSGDPSCGQPHPVSRCAPSPSGCALTSGTTLDVPDR